MARKRVAQYMGKLAIGQDQTDCLNLACSTKASVHLFSGLMFKRNMLSKTFVPNNLLSRQAFEQFALDWPWSVGATAWVAC